MTTRLGPKTLKEYATSPYVLIMLWLRGRERTTQEELPLFKEKADER